MMLIENKFDMGQTVYLKTDENQLARLVTGIRLRPGGTIMYDLSQGKDDSVHYEFEIAEEYNILKTSTN